MTLRLMFLLLVLLSSSQQIWSEKLASDSRTEPFFVAKLFPPSFQQLMEERAPFGKCWMTSTLCFKHTKFSARLVDDSVCGYEDFNVGNDEESCLRRAKFYFTWCGNLQLYPVAMIFAPTGATSSYPPDDVVKAARIAEAAQAIDKTDYGDYTQPEIWYGGGHRQFDDQSNEFEVTPAHEPSGWKTVSVFVHGSAYGQRKAWNGQYQQDQWVVNLLQGKRGGYFVDLAAYDAVQWSNSFTLEQDFGWDGLCIEANSDRMWGLSHRRCRVIQALVGSDAGDHHTFTSVGKCGPGCAGIVGAGFDNKEIFGRAHRMPAVSMKRLLADFDAPRIIDYLSLDVEGGEDLVLADFPFEHHSVLIMSVERPTPYAVDLLREQGFSYLRSLPPWNPLADDEMWVHHSLPHVQEMLQTFGVPEPEVRLHWHNYK